MEKLPTADLEMHLAIIGILATFRDYTEIVRKKKPTANSKSTGKLHHVDEGRASARLGEEGADVELSESDTRARLGVDERYLEAHILAASSGGNLADRGVALLLAATQDAHRRAPAGQRGA